MYSAPASSKVSREASVTSQWSHGPIIPGPRPSPAPEGDFFVDNLLVIIEMIWWTSLAPWEFEFPFAGSLISTFPRSEFEVRTQIITQRTTVTESTLPTGPTGVPHLQENATLKDPTIGLCLGS